MWPEFKKTKQNKRTTTAKKGDKPENRLTPVENKGMVPRTEVGGDSLKQGKKFKSPFM